MPVTSRNAQAIPALTADPTAGTGLAAPRIEGFWRSAFRRLRRNRLAFASGIFVLALNTSIPHLF